MEIRLKSQRMSTASFGKWHNKLQHGEQSVAPVAVQSVIYIGATIDKNPEIF